jgi:hypothetical protein
MPQTYSEFLEERGLTLAELSPEDKKFYTTEYRGILQIEAGNTIPPPYILTYTAHI